MPARFYNPSAKSVLAGVATASILMAFMWWQVGRHYASILCFEDPEFIPQVFLFYFELFPFTLLIAFTAGVVVGALGGEGRLSRPSYRGMVASVVFTILLNSLLATVMHPDSSMRSVAGITNLIITFVKAVIVFSFFWYVLAFAALPFILAAVVGSALGNLLWDKRKRLYTTVLCGTVILSCAISTWQGVRMGAIRVKFEKSLPARTAYIERELVSLPKGTRFLPRFQRAWDDEPVSVLARLVNPRIQGAICAIPDGELGIETNTSGGIQFGYLRFIVPENVELASKRQAQRFLVRHGVHKAVADSVVQDQSGQWMTGTGVFNVSITNP